jgi:hypothetical protein
MRPGGVGAGRAATRRGRDEIRHDVSYGFRVSSARLLGARCGEGERTAVGLTEPTAVGVVSGLEPSSGIRKAPGFSRLG